MATLEELAGIDGTINTDPTTDDDLKARVEKAMLVVARSIEVEDAGTTDHAKRLALAKSVYSNPQSARDQFLRAMVAANASANISVILAATDQQILDAVEAAWNTFI